jgi:hypothetical protein
MIRTEIDITNPQKVEVIETGEIGYVTCFDNKDGTFFITDREGKGLGWCKPKQLRPIEDERLVFDVNVDEIIPNGVKACWLPIPNSIGDYRDYTFQVIATPKEKSLEDMSKEQLIEMVKQLKK